MYIKVKRHLSCYYPLLGEHCESKFCMTVDIIKENKEFISIIDELYSHFCYFYHILEHRLSTPPTVYKKNICDTHG